MLLHNYLPRKKKSITESRANSSQMFMSIYIYANKQVQWYKKKDREQWIALQLDFQICLHAHILNESMGGIKNYN